MLSNATQGLGSGRPACRRVVGAVLCARATGRNDAGMTSCAVGAGGDALLADLGLVIGARAADGAPVGELAVRTARRLLALACDAVRHTATLSTPVQRHRCADPLLHQDG